MDHSNEPIDSDSGDGNGDAEPPELRPNQRLRFAYAPDRLAAQQHHRGMKIRLALLMVLLLVVMVAMKEAGKPERWLWMGFDQPNQPNQSSLSDRNDSSGDPAGQTALVIEEDDVAVQSPTGEITNDFRSVLPGGGRGEGPEEVPAEEMVVDDRSSNKLGGSAPPKWLVDFWRDGYAKLSKPQQRAFFVLLRRVSNARLQPPELDLPFSAAIERMAKWQVYYQNVRIGEIAAQSDPVKKKALTEALFALDKRFKQTILPTLIASSKGEDFLFAGQLAVKDVYSVIEPMVIAAVQDFSSMGNEDDQLAWWAAWDRAASARGGAAVEDVSLIQLNGQPSAYRGRWLSLSGTVLRVRRRFSKRSQLPVDEYFELWLDLPGSHNSGLVNVFTPNLPAALEAQLNAPTVGGDRVDEVDVNFPLMVNGVFFKIRSYVDAEKQVAAYCPVLIAKTVSANREQTRLTTTVGGQGPSPVIWSVFLVAAAMMAGRIAWFAYQTTATRSRSGSGKKERHVHHSLQQLASDGSIKNTAQRLQQLGQPDRSPSDQDAEGEEPC